MLEIDKKGRSKSKNTFDTTFTKNSIVRNALKILNLGSFRGENIYFKKSSSKHIINILKMKSFKEHLIQPTTLIKDALLKLDALASNAILFIVDEKYTLIGSLTDGDIRRGLIKGFTIDSYVTDVIQNTPKFIKQGEQDIYKILKYRESNFKILPVLNKKNQVIEIINFRKKRSYLPFRCSYYGWRKRD